MKRILTTYFICTSFYLMAQTTELKREIKYTAEVGTYLSTNGETPFWLRANQYGTVPLTSPIVTLRGSISSDYKKAVTKEDQYKLSKFDWGYGLNIVANVGKENQLLIPEAYIKAKFGAFEIYAGRRKEIFGLVDSTLSSGSYIWSGNALPMPKIQIMNKDFVPLGITKGFLSFKGSFAHGWFENDRTDVKNFYLHQKSLYFRLGKPDWKFKFYGGFNHQVQWGGELKYPDPTGYLSKNGKLPSSLNDYFLAITGKSLGKLADTAKFAGNDSENRIGNHLGSLDIGFDFNLKKIKVLIYRQNFYETGTLFFLSSVSDGLSGISITNLSNKEGTRINKVTFEYFNSFNQGGNLGSDEQIGKLRGMIDYFNHGQYIDGWSYKNKVIGNAFIIPANEINGKKSYDNRLFSNNRVEAYYIAVDGIINQKINFECRLSYSINGGTYVVPYSKLLEQFSGIVKLKFPVNVLDKVFFTNSFSYDSGNLLKNSFGIYIGLAKIW